MSLEDRDWYREEHARRNGHKAAHEWGRKNPIGGQTIYEFLAKERAKEIANRKSQRKPFHTKYAMIFLLIAAFSIATLLAVKP